MSDYFKRRPGDPDPTKPGGRLPSSSESTIVTEFGVTTGIDGDGRPWVAFFLQDEAGQRSQFCVTPDGAALLRDVLDRTLADLGIITRRN